MIDTNLVLQKAIQKGFNPKKISDYHHKNKSVSLDEYARNYRKTIFDQNKDVKIIYLDMLYWIYLREVYRKETQDSVYRRSTNEYNRRVNELLTRL